VTIKHNLYESVKHTIYPPLATVACYPRLPGEAAFPGNLGRLAA
jgi:hypothetical protein